MGSNAIRLWVYPFLFFYHPLFPYYSACLVDAKVSQVHLGAKAETAHVAGAAAAQGAAAGAAMDRSVEVQADTTSPEPEQLPQVCPRATLSPNWCASRRRPATAVACVQLALAWNDRTASNVDPMSS